MTRNALIVFGALRDAEELWLEPWEVAVKARLPIRAAAAGLSWLARAGIVVKRRAPNPHISKSEYALANGVSRDCKRRNQP